jgi:hypothetical protein
MIASLVLTADLGESVGNVAASFKVSALPGLIRRHLSASRLQDFD